MGFFYSLGWWSSFGPCGVVLMRSLVCWLQYIGLPLAPFHPYFHLCVEVFHIISFRLATHTFQVLLLLTLTYQLLCWLPSTLFVSFIGTDSMRLIIFGSFSACMMTLFIMSAIIWASILEMSDSV